MRRGWRWGWPGEQGWRRPWRWRCRRRWGQRRHQGWGCGAELSPPLPAVILSRRQKRLQLLRIRQKEAKRRQSLAPPEGTYRRKPPPVKRYAGDVLAPVSPCPGGAVPVAVGPR